MPKFFLDLHDGASFIRDPYGLNLADKEEARREAISVLPDMARLALPDGNRRDFTVDVRTAIGELIYTATLSFRGRWLTGLDREVYGPEDDTVSFDRGRASMDGRRPLKPS